MKNLEEWLGSLGLARYAQVFVENGIDLSVVRHLTDQDLKDIGVLLGHRRKLLSAATELELGNVSAPATIETVERSDAERRLLSVMFCDLVGSTALSSRLDPEEMREVLASYHTCVAETIGRFNGTIAKYTGDGVLAYFGYPRAYEDDTIQAVSAGLAIIEALRTRDMSNGAALEARVGIATGTVVVGDHLGEGMAHEQAVVGETPNLAARLQAHAQPGTVLICADTHRLTAGHFSYRGLGSVALKGWSQPIPAWQVLALSGEESRFEAQRKTGVTSLLGRDEELDALLHRWRRAVKGEGSAVVLTGEPGIGKSHIILALQERLKGEPHSMLRFFCSPQHTNSALYPFVGQLSRAARFDRDDTPAKKIAKLETLVSQVSNRTETLALFASLLSLPPDSRYALPALTPQKLKERSLAVLTEQLSDIASRQPTVVIFEDAHWMDPTSLELLTRTLEQVPQMPVLLVITARPEFVPPWPEHHYLKTISLNRLSRRDGLALIARTAGGKALPEQVVAEILARTDGIPLFVEELTKMIIESGLLIEQQGQYLLDKPLPSHAIPTTLHASLMARLDRLAPVRDVAQIGAVVGREFSYELVSAVAGMSHARLEAALDELVHSELVFRRGEIPEAIYNFRHALVRDAAYAGLLKSRRVQLHAAIAAVFEERFPDITETQPEILAHHLGEAGLHEKAAGYWLRAGTMAGKRFANVEAIAHLHHGIECVGRLPESLARDRLELDLQVALAPCFIATPGPASSKAVTTFTRARALCDRLDDPPEHVQVMLWLVTASVVRGELPQALETITDLLRLAKARGDRAALLNTMRGYAMIFLFMGRFIEARDAISQAVATFDASTDVEKLAARAAGQDAGVANLALMSWTLWILGDVEGAESRIVSALDRANAMPDPHTKAYACYYASVLYALRGEMVIAHEYAERCYSLSEEHGFRQWRGLSSAVRGICATALDPASSKMDEVMEALEEYRAAGYQLGITALAVLLASALLAKDKPDAALEIIDQSLATTSHERIFEAELYRLKARALTARGTQEPEISRLLEHALETARNQHARSLELRVANDLAARHIGGGERDAAQNLLAPIYAKFSDSSQSEDLRTAKLLLEGKVA